eukprot:gene8003-8862_t
MVTGRDKFSIKCVGKPSNSHLWKINRNPPSYLFGTIHYPWDVLWKNPEHIHKNVKYAFKKSRSIYTELDFSNVTTVTAMEKCRFLPGNLTLRHVIPTSLLIRLKRHLAYVKRSFQSWLPKHLNSMYSRTITADILFRILTQNWRRKRPVWIVVLIMLELTPSSVKRQQKDILDLFLTKRAKSRGNSIGGLETAEDQCGPFNNINHRQALFLLNYTLNIQELIRDGKMTPKRENQQDKILKVYLCGNLKNGMVGGSNKLLANNDARNYVSDADVKRIDEIEEYLMNELVYKRNQKMATRIEQILKTNQAAPFFFAVGTGHLTGNLSIVELLQNKGHIINHIKPHDRLKGQRKWTKRRERRKDERQRKRLLQTFRETKTPTYQNNFVRQTDEVDKTTIKPMILFTAR